MIPGGMLAPETLCQDERALELARHVVVQGNWLTCRSLDAWAEAGSRSPGT